MDHRQIRAEMMAFKARLTALTGSESVASELYYGSAVAWKLQLRTPLKWLVGALFSVASALGFEDPIEEERVRLRLEKGGKQ